MTAPEVGILTFHRCINYGSYWQARCLANGLLARGYNVRILDHHSPRVNLAEWKCAFQPVLPSPVPTGDQRFYRSKIERFLKAFEELPLSPSFPIEEPSHVSNYDIVVVGSDEVWNLSHPWYGKYPLFYGENISAEHLISYAASFGNYDAQQGLHPYWAEKLRRFEMISVRDKNSQIILENALGVRPAIVLDPCLQFHIDPEERVNGRVPVPYIAVYGHNFSKPFIEHVRKYAKRRHLTLVSIGYRNDWADRQWIEADPHDFAHFMAHSTAVVTNFFHGCVFALSNEKPFLCETSSYRSNKLRDLMGKMGSEQHLYEASNDPADYDELLSRPLAPSITDRIRELRAATDDYLNKALNLEVYR